ncbi:response regulator [Allohahella marinimesophila]|uniref:Transcriptional regulatory protein n=1 Tax=Allohahella marinimesophila TaxID=1054972 RepID=A0ABP7Q2H4_9GAMM
MNSIRLLIAEDDRQIAEIQRRFIERINTATLSEGANADLPPIELCGIAHTLADARDQIEVLQPDLVLLDVWFPDGSGLELLRELRAGDSRSDVILITAAKEVDTLRSALRGGVFDYILKPLVFERLHEALLRFSQHLRALEGLENVAQAAVDALLPRPQIDTKATGVDAPKAQPGDRLPKGIDALTLEKIRTTLRKQRTWTAESAGSEIGASRTTARRYLEYLVSAGELVAEVNYGAVGRPERHYILADDH